MRERLRFNAAANGFTNIDVVAAAVGPAAGTATLHVRRANYGQSSMLASPGFEPITVPVLTLAGVVAERALERIDAMKIDVEGFEDQALLPFFGTAARSLWPRRILIEIAARRHWREDLIAFMLGHGYRETWRGAGDAVLEFRP
jgi:FkbM family methyltransferase